MELLARYPNNTKLVDTGFSDEFGNSKLLMYENGVLLSNTKFSGVVYINETTFQVYGNAEFTKTGIFKIGMEVDWNAETPRQKYNKAYQAFTQNLKDRINSLNGKCFCQYPRIIDYIENRFSDDSRILQSQMQNLFLISLNSGYDSTSGVETVNYECRICKSTYVYKYRERGIDELKLKENKNQSPIGKNIIEYAPNFLTAYFNEVFCRESYIHREKLIKSDCECLINYLFELK